MASTSRGTYRTIERLLKTANIPGLVKKISPLMPDEKPLSEEIPEQRKWNAEACENRRNFIEEKFGEKPFLAGKENFSSPEELRGNIENYIGMTQIPTGIIGPLRINGTEACGDFYVPLATTEGALVASYHRGACVASACGGVSAVCLTEAVQRAPSFEFDNLGQLGVFLIWLMENFPSLQNVVAEKSRFAQLVELKPNITGNQISLILEYTTGDAAGQNMVTLCTEAVCRHIADHSPVKPKHWYVEGNLSGDKKATSQSFTQVRGKKVTTEAVLKRKFIESMLHTTPEKMMKYWSTSVINGVQSGSIGVNGHFANGLTAIFLACGQDAACVSEAAVGTTRFDLTENGDLYVSVTLPNLIVGTIGGATHLPTQRECLEILDCVGEGKSRKFAEICAALVLCGEISITAAITAGDFARAHALYGRKKK